MNNDQSLFFLEILSAIKQASFTVHNSLNHISMDNFGLSDFQYHKASLLGILQINRLCSSGEYLLSNNKSDLTYSSFRIEQLLEQISSTFSTTVSEYFPVSINCYTRLNRTFSVYTDDSKLELAILQLLYCSLKNASIEKLEPIKVTFYVTETKTHIVFHIRDAGKTLSDSVVSPLNSPYNSMSFKCDKLNYDAVMSQAVAVAKKAVSELSGKLEYAPLKTGNRFDIYLPKKPADSHLHFASQSVHVPNRVRYSAQFAEFILSRIEQNFANKTEEL